MGTLFAPLNSLIKSMQRFWPSTTGLVINPVSQINLVSLNKNTYNYFFIQLNKFIEEIEIF